MVIGDLCKIVQTFNSLIITLLHAYIYISMYVTRSGKTGLNRTFCISRNTYLKYSMHCPSLVVQSDVLY